MFNPETGEYTEASVDATLTLPKVVDRRKRELLILDFGAAFFLDKFITIKKYDNVLNKLPFGNKDTLKAMISFYTLANLANVNADDWYSGSYASYLYPDAGLDSRRISEFLKALGREKNYRAFFPSHIDYVRRTVSGDEAVLIDSSGLPNSVHFPLTAVSNHNGKINRELRIIAVVQKDTGMPLFFRYVPGNIVDVNTIVRTVHEMVALGVGMDYCILDAGYYNDLIFDQFAFASIDFMTRVNSGHGIYKSLVDEHVKSLERKKNWFAIMGGCYLSKRYPAKSGQTQMFKHMPISARTSPELLTSQKSSSEIRAMRTSIRRQSTMAWKSPGFLSS